MPLPVYNTVDCDNDKKQMEATAFWNQLVNKECSEVATEQGQNNVTSCVFETQFASFVRYPIMFTGSLQDTVWLNQMCYSEGFLITTFSRY